VEKLSGVKGAARYPDCALDNFFYEAKDPSRRICPSMTAPRSATTYFISSSGPCIVFSPHFGCHNFFFPAFWDSIPFFSIEKTSWRFPHSLIAALFSFFSEIAMMDLCFYSDLSPF